MERRSTRNAPTREEALRALAEPARRAGLVLEAHLAERLALYTGLVLEWSARVDLTAARTAEVFLGEHVADALPLLPHLAPGPLRVVDVGSGAGLPGLVLAVLRPELHVVLLEPRERRWAFLREAIRRLGLAGAEVRRERLEEHLASPTFDPFDVAVSRATWSPSEWLSRAPALLRPGGLVLALEGREQVVLPEGAQRHPYPGESRVRSVLVWRPPVAGTPEQA